MRTSTWSSSTRPDTPKQLLCAVSWLQDLLFYQLPQHANFYLELVNMLAARDEGALHATLKVLFTRMDALRLEPIVGSARSQKLLKGGKSTFLFC